MGIVTVEDVPEVSTPLILQYQGCEFGGEACDLEWHLVAETRTGTDGSYRMSGQVPEEYCAVRTLISIVGGDIVDARAAGGCGERVVDFVLYCDSDLPRNVPECRVTTHQ